MSDRVVRIDLHTEITPPGAKVMIPQQVNAEVQATQCLVKLSGEPVLRTGDEFSCGHVPKVGVFEQPPPRGTGVGRLARPGQELLKVNGVAIATQDGTNTSCSEGVQEM